MVKNKRMSRSTILVVALSLLLVLSLALGLTGAWFTSQATSSNVDPVSLVFGNVNVNTATNYVNVHVKNSDGTYPAETAASNANRELVSDGTHNPGEMGYVTTYGAYLIEAGTRISSGISFTNDSNVGIYYIIRTGASQYYVLTNSGLQNISSYSDYSTYLTDATMSAAGTKNVAYTVTLKETAYLGFNDSNSDGTADTSTQDPGAIWEVSLGGVSQDISTQYGVITNYINAGGTIMLSNYVFSQAFTVRAIQSDNIAGSSMSGSTVAEKVYNYLTNDSNFWFE